MATLRGREDQAVHSPQSSHAPDLSGLSLEPTPRAPAPPVPKPSSLPAARPPRPSKRPAAPVEDEDEEGDPFGDDNVVETPAMERPEPRW